jgi:hypothetical protein
MDWLLKTGPHFDPADTDLDGLEADIWFRRLNGELVSWLVHYSKLVEQN